MSDENDSSSAPASEKPAAERADAPTDTSARDEVVPEVDPTGPRVDVDGLPLDRAPTLDDVRETHGVHGRYALGCTIVIVATIVAFWLIRGGLGG